MILAIDPGNTESAYAIVDDDYAIIDAAKVVNDEMLAVIEEVQPYDTVCIESIQSYGMAVGRSVFETCIWIGRFYQHSVTHGIKPNLYARPSILRGVIGEAKGNDAKLRQALLTRFGGDKKGEPLNILKGQGSDKRSAYAIAVYHLDGAKLGEW